MNTLDTFKETNLPPKVCFNCKSNSKQITVEDYKHANKVWNMFKLKNLGEYHDLYVQTDTALLADIFENFRNLCLKEYELDPAYFYTTPGLALEASLKITNARIETLTDIDMLLTYEKG